MCARKTLQCAAQRFKSSLLTLQPALLQLFPLWMFLLRMLLLQLLLLQLQQHQDAARAAPPPPNLCISPCQTLSLPPSSTLQPNSPPPP